MKRLFVIFAIGLVIFLGWDLYRWRDTLQRIEKISQLKGQTLQEARAYLDANRDALAIADIREYKSDNTDSKIARWLIVKLNRVSYTGVLISWVTGPDNLFSRIEISGLIMMSIDNERISHIQPIE